MATYAQLLVILAASSVCNGRSVSIWQSSEAYPSTSDPDRLIPYPAVNVSSRIDPSQPTITVNVAAKNQEILGFGGAITDSVASIFSQLKPELQDEVVEALWGPSGQRYNLGRLTIGATDFSTSIYSYNEVAGDLNMSYFTIDHDRLVIIPLALRAQQAASSASEDLQWLSTPWSPPGWMKRNGYMRNSEEPGLLEKDEIHEAYAQYLKLYFDEYKAAGVNIRRMTIQNEPHVAGQFFITYPCNGMNGTQEAVFLKRFLGPVMNDSHPEIEIYIHDDQKDIMIDYVTAVMEDKEAAAFVDGVAFHWYGSNLNNYQFLSELYAKYPQLPFLATEATLEAPIQQGKPWYEGTKYGIDIIGDLNGHTTGWIEWNVLLDKVGGPTCQGPSSDTDCPPLIGNCDAAIRADLENQVLIYTDSYAVMAHFSRFMPRGSTHVTTTNNVSDFNVTSVITPDNELVTVIINQAATNQTYQLQLSDQPGLVARITVPANSVQTLRVPLNSSTPSAAPLYGSYRQDYYLSNEQYPEKVSPMNPVTGGRVHLLLPNAATINPKLPLTVSFNKGLYSITLKPGGNISAFEWVHAQVAPDASVWVSFHTQSNGVIASLTDVTVLDADLKEVATSELPSFPSRDYGLRVTLITTRHSFSQAVVHLHNYGTSSEIITRIAIGNQVVSPSISSLQPGQHTVVVATLSGYGEGDVLPVRILTGRGEHVGNGARLTKEIYPLEAWVKSSQCPYPFPGANQSNFEILRSTLSLDTMFMSSACNADVKQVANAAIDSGYRVLLTDNFYQSVTDVNNTNSLAAVFLSDEGDDSVEDTARLWNKVIYQRSINPKLATYIGGHSNHLNGMFSGIADIQGFDFYVAACAPHITGFFEQLSLRAPYDMLRNVRNNHMPLTTWLYSQGLTKNWNYMPHANEIAIQIAQTVLSGSKSVMLFQADVDITKGLEVLTPLMASLSYLNETLRIADVDGAIITKNDDEVDSMVQGFQHPEGLLVMAANFKADGYNDILCEVFAEDHWTFVNHTINQVVATVVGQSFKGQVSEVVAGQAVALQDGVRVVVDGSRVTFENLQLGTEQSLVRFFWIE